jgi:hypothetical protein
MIRSPILGKALVKALVKPQEKLQENPPHHDAGSEQERKTIMVDGWSHVTIGSELDQHSWVH